MTVFREYGPFKGIHNSTNNLTQKQNYVLDARNVVVNQDNGDIQKRPAAVKVDALSECIGIAKYISNKLTDSEDLFICGTENKVKDTVASVPTTVPDFLGAGSFPSKAANDYFSSFMYGGNLYYNYGQRIYKYDGRNAQPASVLGLHLTDGTGLTDDFMFRIYGCDNNQDVAFIYEKEVLNLPWKTTPFSVSIEWNTTSGVGLHNRYALLKNYVFSSSNANPVVIDYDTNSLQVGDRIYLSVIGSNLDEIDIRASKRQYEVFTVSSIDTLNKTISFSNPRGLNVGFFGDIEQTSVNTYWYISPFVIEIYIKNTTTGVYELIEDSSLRGGQYCITPYFAGMVEILSNIYAGTFSNVPYESPQFPRKTLPLCKHISQLNSLMFMSCPKVSEGLVTDDTDFDYQTLAWSSENPEDTVETWGGSSAIIGTEDEGRIYASIPNNGNLVIFKQRAIYFTEPPLDGQISPIKVIGSSVGCSHPTSIQECNGVLFFFMEGKGIFLYRAGMAQAQEASAGFRGLFKESALQGKVVQSTHDVNNSRYILDIGGTIFVYDYLLDSWWIWSGFNSSSGMEYFQNTVIGVNSSFNLFKLDPTAANDNFGSNTAISAYILTNWFTGFDAEVDKKLKAVRFWCLNGSSKLTLEILKNFRNTIDQSFTVGNSSDIIDVADFTRSESGKRKFKAIALKISNATLGETMKVTGWAIDYEPTGVESRNFEGAR